MIFERKVVGRGSSRGKGKREKREGRRGREGVEKEKEKERRKGSAVEREPWQGERVQRGRGPHPELQGRR